MKKTVLVSLIGIMAVSAANAGFWSRLGFGKSAEPQTLEQACNKDDITAICPEIALGEKTLVQCLSENISSLSKKCANYVKKSVSDGVADAKEKAAEAKAEWQAKKEELAAAKAERQAERAAEKEARKAEIAEKKAQVKAAGKDVADSAKQTGKDLKETADSMKNLF